MDLKQEVQDSLTNGIMLKTEGSSTNDNVVIVTNAGSTDTGFNTGTIPVSISSENVSEVHVVDGDRIHITVANDNIENKNEREVMLQQVSVEEYPQTENDSIHKSEPIFTQPMTVEEFQASSQLKTQDIPELTGMKCLICEDRASGYHYSVFSCEGCKGFFKRTVQKGLTYTCRVVEGNCAINKATRNSCQYCRYNKCLQMGMKKEAVREDRSPGGKHRHKRQKLDDVTGCVLPDGSIGLLPKDEFHDAILEALVNAQPDYFPKTEQKLSATISVNELMQYGYSELRCIIEWAKKVPGFQDISMDDQMCLLKSSFMELNVLRLAYRSMNLENCIKFADGIVIPTDIAQGMGWGKELINATIEFTCRLRELKIDKTEFCIMNAIVLLFPDAAGIQEKIQVLSLQTKILDTLRKYTLHNYPSENRRYGKLLLRLPSLRTVSAKAAEKFLSLTLDGTIQINDLVFEMIT